MDSDVKRHIGIVTGAGSDGTIVVKIDREQCEGCRLGKFCNVTQENTLSVPVEVGTEITVGSTVSVEENPVAEKKAIWLCLVLPCILFVVSVMAFSSWISSLWGCIIGVFALTVYFGLFYMFGDGVNKNNGIIYKVKKI